VARLAAFLTQTFGGVVYTKVMDQMLTPPADRPKQRPMRLVVVLGLTALMYLMVAHHLGGVAETIAAARVG
jgi:hypothetical protein